MLYSLEWLFSLKCIILHLETLNCSFHYFDQSSSKMARLAWNVNFKHWALQHGTFQNLSTVLLAAEFFPGPGPWHLFWCDPVSKNSRKQQWRSGGSFRRYLTVSTIRARFKSSGKALMVKTEGTEHWHNSLSGVLHVYALFPAIQPRGSTMPLLLLLLKHLMNHPVSCLVPLPTFSRSDCHCASNSLRETSKFHTL